MSLRLKMLKIPEDNLHFFLFLCAIYNMLSPCNRKHVGACVHHDEEEDSC